MHCKSKIKKSRGIATTAFSRISGLPSIALDNQDLTAVNWHSRYNRQ